MPRREIAIVFRTRSLFSLVCKKRNATHHCQVTSIFTGKLSWYIKCKICSYDGHWDVGLQAKMLSFLAALLKFQLQKRKDKLNFIVILLLLFHRMERNW